MNPLTQVGEARAVGESVTTEGMDRLRNQLLSQFRRTMGITGERRSSCDDPTEAYFEPDSITRQIHADPPAMLIGGLAALLFQMLHPLVMAGVAQHSNYRKDPLGRLGRTAAFLGTTTFRSRREADAAITHVRRVHASVSGTAPDGRPYAADDPALVAWVHAAEVRCFLNAALIYGPRLLTSSDQDRYIDEMSRVAFGLGAVGVPRSASDLDVYFDRIRPELRLTREARTARNFVLRGIGRWPHEITTYGLLVSAAQGVLPPWARRQLHLPAVPAGDRLAVRPATRVLSTALRWVAAPPTSSGHEPGQPA